MLGNNLNGLLNDIATNNKVSVASKQLAQTYASSSPSELLPTLLTLALSSSPSPTRQLAAIELRKLVEPHWPALSNQVKESLKNSLLQSLIGQNDPLVAHSLARVVTEVAKLELSSGTWNDLVPTALKMCESPITREMGVYLLYTLLSEAIESIASWQGTLFTFFSNLIGHSDEKLDTLVSACQSLGKLGDFIDERDSASVKAFQELIPIIVRVLSQCIAAQDEANTLKILEMFTDMLELETPLLNAHFGDLIQFYMSVCGNTTLSDQIRMMGLAFIECCLEYKKSLLQKRGLISPILAGLFPIIAEDEPLDRDEQYPSMVACHLVSLFGVSFPSNRVFPEILKLSKEALNSPHYGLRKASMLTIFRLVEGCADRMREEAHQLMGMIEHGLKDSHPMVRRAACMALGTLAEELEIEFQEQHAVFLPLLFTSLDDPTSATIVADILNALDTLLEGLGDAIALYMNPLMQKLIHLLENGTPTIQTTSMNCIGSIAHSAETDFEPFCDLVMQRILMIMSLSDNDEIIQLRAITTETAGEVAFAVGKERFAPLLEQTMKLAVSGLECNESYLTECSYTLFGVLARTFGEDFSPFLPLILPRILKSCASQEKDWTEMVAQEESLEDDEDDEDEDEIGFSLSAAHEKRSSLDALAELFVATRSAFIPYALESINIVLLQFGYYYEGARTSAVQCALKFFCTYLDMSCGSEWDAGLPLKKPMDAQLANLGSKIMESIVLLLGEEEERMAVANIFHALAEALKTSGPALVSFNLSDGGSVLEALSSQALMVLDGTHICHSNEDDEELSELNSIAISASADFVAALSGALGGAFGPLMPKILPVLSKYYKPTRTCSDRSMTMGALAEVVVGQKSFITPYTQPLFSLFLQGIQDPEEDVQSNAGFGMGVLIYHSTMDLTGQYPSVLGVLQSHFEKGSGTTNRTDNACGTVCRMILKASHAMPIDQIMPVLLAHLPLKKDFEENTPIFECLLALLSQNHPSVVNMLGRLFQIFESVLGEPKDQLTDSVRRDLNLFLSSFKASHPDQFQSLSKSL